MDYGPVRRIIAAVQPVKLVSALVFLTTLLEGGAAHAADPAPRDNALEADLGSGVLGVGFERRFAPVVSGRLTLQLNSPWYTDILGGPDSDVRGFGAELRPFIFPLGTALEGLYVSPFGRVAAIRAQDDLPEKVSGVGWSAGVTAGYGFLLVDQRLLLRFGAGVQYWAFEIHDDSGDAGVSGFYPDVDIIAGYAF